MLAHKSNFRASTFSSFYFYMSLITLLLVVAAVLTSGLFNSSQPSATLSGEGSYQSFRSAEYSYSISFPAEWKVINQPEQGVFSASSLLRKDEDQGGTNYSQRKFLSSTGQSTALSFSKIDVVAVELESEISARDFMLAKSTFVPEGNLSDIKVAGRDAVRIDVQTGEALQNHSDSQVYTSVFVTSGKHGYIIAGFASAQVFDSILNSFQTF